ncbi:unnamed protein product [Ranitomeya imitator]|uniref:Uncharacterized protein n=1 Tax=Ranitomeya imitator TaxID=111125 RepID=A0ABN9MEF5_9NEOB|nr:unnamed protein product [Ranitomeya imitator]
MDSYLVKTCDSEQDQGQPDPDKEGPWRGSYGAAETEELHQGQSFQWSHIACMLGCRKIFINSSSLISQYLPYLIPDIWSIWAASSPDPRWPRHLGPAGREVASERLLRAGTVKPAAVLSDKFTFLSNYQYLMVDIAINITITLTMSLNNPATKLAPYRPPGQLLSPSFITVHFHASYLFIDCPNHSFPFGTAAAMVQ